MANQIDPGGVAPPLIPPMIPQEQAGFSPDLLNRINPVGGLGEIRGGATGAGDYGTPLTDSGLRAGGFDVPANIFDQIHQSQFGQPLTEQNAIHELLHAISGQRSPYKEDLAAGFPTLKTLVSRDFGGLPMSVQLDVRNQLASGDDWHLFTALAHPFLMGVPLPPPLAQYFAALKP